VTDHALRATYRLATPNRAGAIAVIELAGDIDAALRALRIKPVEVGVVALRDLCGVDQGVVARWTTTAAHLTPHGGSAVVRNMLDELERAGVAPIEDDDPRRDYPEAADANEAMMLAAMARAASSAAIDLLLDQPERWRSWNSVDPTRANIERASRMLNRLIDPPTIVAVGRTNIGKSTLTNALATRAVSIVADQPGATRDHVGVTLELPSPVGGVTVRWIDTPGLRAVGADETIERRALTIARRVVASADLIALCGDAEHGFADPEELDLPASIERIRVGLRCDLKPVDDADVSTSALTGAGVAELAQTLRARLVPDWALQWPGPWLFDQRLLDDVG